VAEKELEFTPRLSLTAEIEYDTNDKWEKSLGISYEISKSLSLASGWHSAGEPAFSSASDTFEECRFPHFLPMV
jgi:hypothetical protein